MSKDGWCPKCGCFGEKRKGTLAGEYYWRWEDGPIEHWPGGYECVIRQLAATAKRLRKLVVLVRELDASYTPSGMVQDGVDVDAIWVRLREAVKNAGE